MNNLNTFKDDFEHNIKELSRDADSTCAVGKGFREQADAFFLVTFHSSFILQG